jgi:CDP-diacylglycerol---serine O-phosphatidyltransferase
MRVKHRYLVPLAVTLLSLACGIASLMSTATGLLVVAGALIFASYILDQFDGLIARALNACTDIGLQLDSLADLVSLGAAPAVLTFIHLQSLGLQPSLAGPLVIIYVLSGAFRLARFNLLPPKTGKSDTLGLTISTSGAILTMAVLTNIVVDEPVITAFIFILLMLGLSLLMLSLIRFPSAHLIVGRWYLNIIYLCLLAASLAWLQLSLAHTLFFAGLGYLGFGLVRAGYNSRRLTRERSGG